MMLYPSLSDLLKKVPNRYSLVNVAAKRARDIAEMAENDPEMVAEEKPVSLALDDIMSGKIVPVENPAEDETVETAENGEEQQ